MISLCPAITNIVVFVQTVRPVQGNPLEIAFAKTSGPAKVARPTMPSCKHGNVEGSVDMERNATTPKPPRFRKSNYFLRRELYGDQNGVQRPSLARGHYERISISRLDNGELKKHIIVGERPTYPYHIVSIRKPAIWTDPDLAELNGVESDGYTDGTGGSIVYWRLVREGGSSSSCGVHLEQVETQIPTGSRLDFSDKYLASAHTAWDVQRDRCVQVLYWKNSGLGIGTRTILQVKYGDWSHHVELGLFVSLVGTCFSALNCTGGYGDASGDGAAISAVFPATVYFFEPFGWGTNRKVPELRHWHTTPETLHGETVEIGVNQYIPRVSVLKLDIYIRQFLLQKFPDKFRGKQPQLQKMFSNYAKRPARVRFGRQSDFRTTQIAVGVMERITASYYIFLLALDHTKRLILPLIARSLSSEEDHSPFNLDNLQHTQSRTIFYQAILLTMGSTQVDIKFLAHDCNRACINVPGNTVYHLCRYHSEMGAMEEIRMDESRVVLEGWRKPSYLDI